MKTSSKIIVALTAVVLAITMASVAIAETPPQGGETPPQGPKREGQECCPIGTPEGVVCICNPIGNEYQTGIEILGYIANGLLYPMGALAFLAFVIGGFTFILANGNEENIKKGKDIMLWAVIGLVVTFASYAILNFFLNALGGGYETPKPAEETQG